MGLTPFFRDSELPVLKQESTLPQCGACGYYKSCKSPKIEPSGKGRKRVLIVSAFPGEEEDKRGKLAVGETSQILRQAVGRAGGDLDRDCWLTNAVICRPTNSKSVDAAVEHCRPNLIKTVTELNPEVIVTLGSEAVMSVMGWLWRRGEGGAFRWRGFRVPNRRINTWVVPTFHPGLLVRERDPVFDKMFLADLRAAFELKDRPYPAGKVPAPDMGDQVTVVKDGKDAARLIKLIHKLALKNGRPVAWDIETTCLKPQGPKSEIISCALSDGLNTVAFPWVSEVFPATRAFLADPRVRKITANGKFEKNWLETKGFKTCGEWWDVNLAAHAIDNASKVRNITGVDFQAVARLGVEDWASEVTPYLVSDKRLGCYTPNRIRTLDLNKVLRYNGCDALYEFLICVDQRKQLGLNLYGD